MEHRRRPVPLWAFLLLLLSSSCFCTLITMGNREGGGGRRDLSLYSDYAAGSENNLGEGGLQKTLIATTDTSVAGMEADEHGVRAYSLLDAFALHLDPETETTVVKQVWVGTGMQDDSLVTVVRVLSLPLAPSALLADGWDVLVLSSVPYLLETAFDPLWVLASGTAGDLVVGDVNGQTWELAASGEATLLLAGYSDGGQTACMSSSRDEVRLLAVTGGLLSLWAPIGLQSSFACLPLLPPDLSAPPVGGNCVLGALDSLPPLFTRTLLWNATSTSYGLYDLLPANETVTRDGCTGYALDVDLIVDTGINTRLCGGSDNVAPLLYASPSGSEVVVFCQGLVYTVDVNKRTVEVRVGYVHGLLWVDDVAGAEAAASYAFAPSGYPPVTCGEADKIGESEAVEEGTRDEEEGDGCVSEVSWEDLQATGSQLFWVTPREGSSTVANNLVEANLRSKEDHLSTFNVLQWLPSLSSTSASMEILASASSGDFLFLSAKTKEKETFSTAHEIIVIDVRTMATSRDIWRAPTPQDQRYDQLMYDAVSGDLLAMVQHTAVPLQDDSTFVELTCALWRIPIDSSASVSASSVLRVSDAALVTSDISLVATSAHGTLGDVHSAAASYQGAWIFVDSRYGRLLLIDTQTGEEFYLEPEWEEVDMNYSFITSISYDNSRSLLYVLGPSRHSAFDMVLASFSFPLLEPEIVYQQSRDDVFQLAMDCPSCQAHFHQATSLLLLRSATSVVAIPSGIAQSSHQPSAKAHSNLEEIGGEENVSNEVVFGEETAEEYGGEAERALSRDRKAAWVSLRARMDEEQGGGEDEPEVVLSRLDSGGWSHVMSSPLTASPSSVSLFRNALPLSAFRPPDILSTSPGVSSVALLTESGETETGVGEGGEKEGGLGVGVLLAVSGICFLVIVTVIAVLVLLWFRGGALFGSAPILAHATPVFDDQISDKDL